MCQRRAVTMSQQTNRIQWCELVLGKTKGAGAGGAEDGKQNTAND